MEDTSPPITTSTGGGEIELFPPSMEGDNRGSVGAEDDWGGPIPEIQDPTPVVRLPNSDQFTKRSEEKRIPIRGGRHNGRKRGHRRVPIKLGAGVLLAYLRSPKKVRRSETGHKLESPKLIPSCPKIQNGNSTTDSLPTSQRRLDSETRYERRLLSHSSERTVSKISPLLLKPQSVSIQGDVFRAGFRTSHIHKSATGNGIPSTSSGISDPSISRRLAPQDQISRRANQESTVPPPTGKQVGYHHQPEEIRSRSETDLRIFGNSVRLDSGACIPNSVHSAQTERLDRVPSSGSGGPSQADVVAVGISEQHVPDSPNGTSSPSMATVVREGLVASSRGFTFRLHPTENPLLRSSEILGERDKLNCGSSPSSPKTGNNSNLRRIVDRLRAIAWGNPPRVSGPLKNLSVISTNWRCWLC